MSREFSGKKCLIVGGSGGIGTAITDMFISKGCFVVQFIHETKRGNHSSLVRETYCNVESETEVQAAFKELSDREKNIDFLINCAGASNGKNIFSETSSGFEDDIRINLTAPYLCSLYAQKLINPGGSIVNIASIRGQTGTPSSLGYAAAKAGIINLTKSLAIQLADRQIRVNCVSPSAVHPTGMSMHWSNEKINRISQDIPLGRLGKPSDISNAVYFFVSELSSFITGQTLSVNGGELMP